MPRNRLVGLRNATFAAAAPWQTAYGWFRELARRFLFQTIQDVVLMLDRERAGSEASPTAGVIDRQLVEAPEAETSG